MVAQQRRQPFVVGDRLNLADDDLPGGLIKLLIGPRRMLLGQQRRLVIVFANEQGREIRQFNVFVGAHVSGCKQGVFRHADVVGHV